MGSEASKGQQHISKTPTSPSRLVLDFIGLAGVELTETSDIMRSGVDTRHDNVQVRTEEYGVPYMYYASSSRLMLSEQTSMKASGDAMELCTHFLSSPPCVVRHGKTSLRANSLLVRRVNQLLLRRVCDQVKVLSALEEELYEQEIKRQQQTYQSGNSNIRLPSRCRERSGSMSSSTTDSEASGSSSYYCKAAATLENTLIAEKATHALQPIVIEFGSTHLSLLNVQHAAVLTLIPVVVRDTSWFRDRANPVFLRRARPISVDEPLLVVSLHQYPVIVDSFGHISAVLDPKLLQFVARRHQRSSIPKEAPTEAPPPPTRISEQTTTTATVSSISPPVAPPHPRTYTGSDYESSQQYSSSFTAGISELSTAAITRESDVVDLEEVSLDDHSSEEETREESSSTSGGGSRKWISWTT